MKHLLPILLVSLMLTACEEAVMDDSSSSESSDSNSTTEFSIVCVGCEFQYALRWRLDASDLWQELASSEGYFCLYTQPGFDDEVSKCYDIEIFDADLPDSTVLSIDIEAQNGFGTFSDAGCSSAFIDGYSGDYDKFEFPCF